MPAKPKHRAARDADDSALRRLRALTDTSTPATGEPSLPDPTSEVPAPPYAIPAAGTTAGSGSARPARHRRPDHPSGTAGEPAGDGDDPASTVPPGYVPVTEEPPPGPFRGLAERLLRGDDPDTPRLSGAGIRVIVAVCVVAALVTGFLLLRSRPEPVPEPLLSAGSTPVPGHTSAPSTGVAPAEGATPPAGEVVVHVGGLVNDPGLVTLPAGSRVADAVEAAGGISDDADPESVGTLNLARHLVDGEQVLVGVDPPPGEPPGGAGPGQETPIDLNTATAEELQALPGVGPVLAESIIEFRTTNGGFTSVEQLLDVSGIGEKRFTELEDRVVVHGPG